MKSGRISRERLDASVRRILQAKARIGLYKERLVDVNALNKHFGKVEWQREAQEISDRGVTLLRDTAHRLPLDGTKPTRALLVALYADPEPYPGEDLERELRSRVDSVTTLRADTRFVKADNLKLPAPDTYDVAILAFFVRVSDRKGNVDIPAEQAALAEKVYKNGKPVVTIGFGSPYLVEHFPQAETWLAAFGISDVAQISVARALFGQIPVRGHLPVTVPGVEMKAGFGIELPANPMTVQPMDASAEAQLQPAFDVIERAIADKAFPGATLAVGYRRPSGAACVRQVELRREIAASECAHDVRRCLADESDCDDDAGGKTGRGRFSFSAATGCADRALFARVGQRAAAGVAARVTVRHLMTHTSGLPPFKEYWRTSKGKPDTLKMIFAEPLESEPGTKMVYSDLRNYFDGGDYRALDGANARRPRERIYFLAAGDERFDVQAAEKTLALDCANGI